MLNALSFDVESWAHFLRDATARPAPRGEAIRRLDDGWIPAVLEQLVTLLDRTGQRATFFIVGELYEWYPDAIDAVAAAGHEIGWHTHGHDLLQGAAQLAREAEASRAFLEAHRPVGFRAPQCQLTPDAYPVLAELGFRYSSSTYRPWAIEAHHGIDELPVATLAWAAPDADRDPWPRNLTPGRLARMLPFGSGLFAATLGPGQVPLIEAMNRRGEPAIVFLHPWQVASHPRLRSWRFRAEVARRNPLCLPYLRPCGRTLERLLDRFAFTTIADRFYGTAERAAG